MTTRTTSASDADDREPVEPGWPDEEDSEEAGEGFSVYDHIRAPAGGRTARRLLALMVEAIRLVWRVARRELVVAALIQVAAAAALTVQLLLVRDLLNVLVPGHGHTASLSASLPYLIPLVATSALIAFATTAQAEQTLLIGELVGRRACADVAAVSAAVDLEAFERPAFHDRLERAQFNAANRNMSAVNSLLGLLGAMLSAVGVFVALIAIQPLVAPLTVLAIVPAWIISMRNSGRLHDFQAAMTPLDRERRYLLSALSGLEFAKEIRAFDIGPVLRRRHDELYTRRVTALRRLIASRLRRSLVADLLGATITGGTLVLLVWLIDQGNVTVASAGTAVFAVIFLVQRLRAMVGYAGRLYEASLFLEDVSGFIELKPQVEAARPRRSAPAGFERLVVDNVSFTYPGARRPSVQNVSFEIDHGEVVALVGENGCGKTTLAKQLAALHTPTSGRILWDETDIATCDPYELRRSIAVIFQDFVRWALPARDNVGIGDADRVDDIERILLAARDAHAHQFLSKLPDGYDTVLSRMFSGGRDLSIGQWQRVALARAFFRDAPFVIMDEPTAALDPLAEYRIFESIRQSFRGRTVLFISHRFSSVRLADRIMVMHAGELTEEGTHEELMAADGRYARMFTLQASAYLGYEVG